MLDREAINCLRHAAARRPIVHLVKWHKPSAEISVRTEIRDLQGFANSLGIFTRCPDRNRTIEPAPFPPMRIPAQHMARDLIAATEALARIVVNNTSRHVVG